MTKFTKKDTHPMSWEEVDELVNVLISKIKASGENMNVVAPMLRTGGIVGGILAIKMRILNTLPVQFKYSYNPTAINQIFSVPDMLVDVPEPINVLLCEGNTSSGSVAVRSAKAIKEKYPRAKIFLATLTKVYGGLETLDGIEQIFYGRMTDENFKATLEEKKRLHLRAGITIFPWENPDDELSDINAAQVGS